MDNEREFDSIDAGETEEDLDNKIDYSQAVLWGTDWTAETVKATIIGVASTNCPIIIA